jgi:hypothetical protein
LKNTPKSPLLPGLRVSSLSNKESVLITESIRLIKSAITLQTIGRSVLAANASALRSDSCASLIYSSTVLDSAINIPQFQVV